MNLHRKVSVNTGGTFEAKFNMMVDTTAFERLPGVEGVWRHMCGACVRRQVSPKKSSRVAIWSRIVPGEHRPAGLLVPRRNGVPGAAATIIPNAVVVLALFMHTAHPPQDSE